jgi:hypothetical protein
MGKIRLSKKTWVNPCVLLFARHPPGAAAFVSTGRTGGNCLSNVCGQGPEKNLVRGGGGHQIFLLRGMGGHGNFLVRGTPPHRNLSGRVRPGATTMSGGWRAENGEGVGGSKKYSAEGSGGSRKNFAEGYPPSSFCFWKGRVLRFFRTGFCGSRIWCVKRMSLRTGIYHRSSGLNHRLRVRITPPPFPRLAFSTESQLPDHPKGNN